MVKGEIIRIAQATHMGIRIPMEKGILRKRNLRGNATIATRRGIRRINASNFMDSQIGTKQSMT